MTETTKSITDTIKLIRHAIQFPKDLIGCVSTTARINSHFRSIVNKIYKEYDNVKIQDISIGNFDETKVLTGEGSRIDIKGEVSVRFECTPKERVTNG